MTTRYSVVIQWSDEDESYVVTLPEFGPFAHTHGRTYAEAAKRAVEALESLIEAYEADGTQLPQPFTLQRIPELLVDRGPARKKSKASAMVGGRRRTG